MRKLIGILVISCQLLASSPVKAQYVRPGDEKSPRTDSLNQLHQKGFANNLSLGGSFILQFGDYTFVEVEPLLSYHFNQNFMVGIGPIYQYESLDANAYGYSLTASAYGGRIAALYFLPDEFSKVFVMGEYDVLNVPEPSFYSTQVDRGYLSLPMLGVGYKEVVSDKVFFCIYGLWNFNSSIYNPFSNPIINFGVDVGLWR